MFGTTDLDAMRLAVRRIDAALRPRRKEWAPEILNDEDVVLGVRPAGFSEDRRLQPTEALAEIDDALDQVSRRVGVLRAQTEAEASRRSLAGSRASGHAATRNTAWNSIYHDDDRPREART
jgi:hypothetical protein